MKAGWLRVLSVMHSAEYHILVGSIIMGRHRAELTACSLTNNTSLSQNAHQGMPSWGSSKRASWKWRSTWMPGSWGRFENHLHCLREP